MSSVTLPNENPENAAPFVTVTVPPPLAPIDPVSVDCRTAVGDCAIQLLPTVKFTPPAVSEETFQVNPMLIPPVGSPS